jgi:hypothetical protein
MVKQSEDFSVASKSLRSSMHSHDLRQIALKDLRQIILKTTLQAEDGKSITPSAVDIAIKQYYVKQAQLEVIKAKAKANES